MNHYDVLGVPTSVSLDEIKKAYKRAAAEWHPDRHPNNKTEATAKFKEVVEAFKVLNDPLQKHKYDMTPNVKQQKAKESVVKPKTKEEFEAERERAKNGPGWNEVIECQFLESKFSGRHIIFQLRLTDAEKRVGCTKVVVVKRRKVCGRCIGDGVSKMVCPACHNDSNSRWGCRRCKTIGELIEVCPVCNGNGLGAWEPHAVTVNVPAKTQTGHAVQILGEGECAPGKAPGYVRAMII